MWCEAENSKLINLSQVTQISCEPPLDGDAGIPDAERYKLFAWDGSSYVILVEGDKKKVAAFYDIIKNYLKIPSTVPAASGWLGKGKI